jgi:hypothetical protein
LLLTAVCLRWLCLSGKNVEDFVKVKQQPTCALALCAIKSHKLLDQMSQLNFFLTQDEIQERLNILLLSDEFLVFNGKFFESQNPLPIHKLSELKIFESLTIWVTNKFLTPICSQKGTRDYLNTYLFDTINDPIIELDNCTMFDMRMSPGRLFFKTGWIKNIDLRLLHKKRAN